MPVRTDWTLDLTVDDALRGQGANADMLRKRSPRIIETTERAVAAARSLLRPVVIYRELDVVAQDETRLLLSGGHSLEGELVMKLLTGAQRVVLVVCTVSGAISELASREMKENMLYGLALDGTGSAATEMLANEVFAWQDQQAAALGWKISIPVSPGEEGWPLAVGQPQIFTPLAGESDAVRLTDSFLMEPIKSMSFVLGLGKDVKQHGTTCNFCRLKRVCRYRKHQAPND